MTISEKIGILIKEGYKPSQASAIAHSMAKRGELQKHQQGGKINIKEENRGKFTAAAKRAGMGVQEFARHVLANKNKYSPLMVKRANFARNATKFDHTQNHQQGGGIFGGLFEGLDFDQLNNVAESGIFGNDFSFEDASTLGLSGKNIGLSGAFAGSLSQDDPSIYSNYVTGAFNQQGAQQLAENQTESFLANPTVEGLDTFGQGLNRGLGRRIRRRLGKDKSLTRRQQRKLEESAQGATPQLQTQANTDLTTATQGLGSLFDIFSNLFQFQQGGEVGGFGGEGLNELNIFKTYQDILQGKRKAAEIALNTYGWEGKIKREGIKLFQEDVGLRQTGKLNAPTREKLAEAFLEQMTNRSPIPFGSRKMQQGGDVARQGYSIGSPYQNRSSITIPGGNIDMSKTAKSLYLIPDVGEPVMAHPFSGQHIFPRANSVREVPMRQYGGDAPDAVAQLELGELIALSDASIVKPKAKEMHKAMKKDKVTDILPADMAYVLSDDPKMGISLRDAKNISLGFGAISYKEGEDDGEEPEEILLSRFYKNGEKKLTPAEILRRVKKEFPISEETDIFAQRSSFRNKESRIPYIQALQYLTRKRKEDLGQEVAPDGFQVASRNPFGVSYTEMLQEMQVNRLKTDPDEGYVSSPVIDKQGTSASPQRAQLGGAIATAIPQLVNSVFGQINAGKTRREAQRLARENEARLRQEALRQQGYLGMGTAAAFGALGAMNPEVQAAQYDPRYINAFPQRLPQSLFDTTAGRIAGANRPFIDAIFANTGDYSRAVNALAPLQQNTVGAMADLGMQAELQNLGLRQNYLQAKDAFSRQQTAANTEAANATTGNRNALLGQAGALGANYFNQQGAISSALTGSLMANDANRFNSIVAARMQGQQALGQGLGAISGAMASPGFQNLFNGQGAGAGAMGAGASGLGLGAGMNFGAGTGVGQPSFYNQYIAPWQVF